MSEPESPQGKRAPIEPERRSRGRPPGRGNTRDDVLAAARTVFADRGYRNASLRAIAAEAGVDAGMVRHFFGDKDGLFRAAMELPIDPSVLLPALLAPGLDGLGERVVRFFLGVWDAPATRGPFLALVRSVTSHEESAAMFREFFTERMLGRIAAALDRPDAELRGSLVASQLVGLAMVRYIIRIEPLASASVDQVVAAVAPTLQRYLTGDVATG
ncbi:MAG TPA: TetR family transcriptional regulator [Mycobacteriales bacterium]